MSLKTGLHPVANQNLAAVVTYLEMTAPFLNSAKPLPSGTEIKLERLSNDAYRTIFKAIGEPWLWISRLVMSDSELSDILSHNNVETWVVRQSDAAIGLIELDFREKDICELAFFGLVKSATGQGLGGPMMGFVQKRARQREISRIHVHTCTLDDPAALPFYRRVGFVPVKRDVEIFADPRQTGEFPATAGQRIPNLG